MTDDAQQFPEMMTIAEAAPKLRLSDSGLRRLIRAGEVRATRIGGRWLISRAEVLRLLEQGTRPIILAGGRAHPRSVPPSEPDDDAPIEQAAPPRAQRRASFNGAPVRARVIG